MGLGKSSFFAISHSFFEFKLLKMDSVLAFFKRKAEGLIKYLH